LPLRAAFWNRTAGRSSQWRIELQLKVAGGTDDGGPLVSKTLKGLDASHVSRDQFRQVELEWSITCACTEEFGDLRDTQSASESHDAAIGLLDDTDPAFHTASRRKTQATAAYRGTGRNAHV
jgi:hypothetical protein